jgi:hypothetical protein
VGNFVFVFHASGLNADFTLEAKCVVGKNRVHEKLGRNQPVW